MYIIFLNFYETNIPFYNDYKLINSTHLHQGLTIEKYFDCPEDTLKKCSKIINLQPSFIKVLENFSSSAYGEIYKVGLNMFLDNPIFGVGIKNFRNNCEYYRSGNFNISDKKFYKKLDIEKKKNFSDNLCSTHPHHTYFELISEIGLYGLITFFTLIFNFYLKIFKSSVRPLIIPIIILLFPFLPSGSFFNNYNSAFFWLIIGLTFAARKNLQKN